MNQLRTSSLRALRVMPRRAMSAATASGGAPVSVTNIESTWASLSAEQRTSLEQQLDQRMASDWNTLSLEEKKAAYYIAFGAHGAREPLHKSGFGTKVFVGVVASLGVSAALFAAVRTRGGEAPHTMNKEWREQTDEYMRSQNANPISGMSSEGYKGKGFGGTSM